ncbi:glycosyltransferase, partial [Nocardiopsis coralliicola]
RRRGGAGAGRPDAALLLLAAAEDTDGARSRMRALAGAAHRPGRPGDRTARRIAAVLAAAERPRITEAALSALPDLPEHYRVRLGGAAAVRRARILFEKGRLAEAEDAVQPFTGAAGGPGHPTAALLAERLAGERRALAEDPPPRTRAAYADAVPGRVLHLVSNALPVASAGYTVRTHRIAAAQRALGLEPSVAAFPGWPEAGLDGPDRWQLDGVDYRAVLPGQPLPGGLAGRIDAGVAEVAALVAELRPAVLHAAGDHRNGTLALRVAARTGLPVVYEVRGFGEETWLAAVGEEARGSERHRLIVARETAVARRADAVVTLSAAMRAELVGRGVAPERITLAPNAVDAELLAARPDGAAFRRAHGIGPDEFAVGSVSSLVGYEGFGVLARAVALLRSRGVPARLLLVGDGPDRGQVERAVREAGLDDAVLPGRVPPDAALQAQAALDVLAVPRTAARVCALVTPLKPVEAMALGTPVAASDLPALRGLLSGADRPGDTGGAGGGAGAGAAGGRTAGLLVEPEDPAALAAALERLYRSPALRAELAADGRAIAAALTWDRVAAAHLDVYTRLGAAP